MDRRQLLTGAAAVAAFAALPGGAGAASLPFFRAPATLSSIFGAQLVAHFAAKDYNFHMTDDGSGLISNWVDRVAGLAVTATTTARPTWGRNSFNSTFPGITFDGVANCFVNTSFAALPTGGAEGSMWIVGQAVSVVATQRIVEYGGISVATVRSLRKNNNDSAIVSDAAASVLDFSGVLLTSPFMLAADWVGTTQNGWLNGVPLTGNPGTIGTLNTGTTRLRIGAGSATSASAFFGGVISDVFFVSGAITTLQRQQAEGVMGWNRWAPVNGASPILPASHPYKGAPP